jgi:hypothetical protein
MKLISLLLAVCISLNVFAASGTHKELELLIDSYHYELSVEWDQKDQTFYDVKTKQFFEEMGQLMSDKGISKDDLLSLIESKTKDKVLLASIKTKLMLAGNAKSQEELIQVIKDSSKDFYVKGASWNGQVVTSVVGGLLIAGFIGFIIWRAVNYECVEWEEKWVCTTRTYGEETNYSRTETVCGWDDVCTRTEKKD